MDTQQLTPEQLSRREAMQWWINLPEAVKAEKAQIHFGMRYHTSLTGREIETIFKLQA